MVEASPGSLSGRPEGWSADEFGRRAFLVDNRAPEHLKVTVFRTNGQQKLIGPMIHLLFPKDDDGLVIIESYSFQLHEHVFEFMRLAVRSDDDLRDAIEQEKADGSYEIVLAYAFFALLASGENGLVPEQGRSLDPSELKTARKFGKTWISDVAPEFVTIHIGPQAQAHLAEQAQRRAFEKESRERNSPVRHWVSEHERHYRSGKIVKIEGFYRGVEPGAGLPIKVKGPKQQGSGV